MARAVAYLSDSCTVAGAGGAKLVGRSLQPNSLASWRGSCGGKDGLLSDPSQERASETVYCGAIIAGAMQTLQGRRNG